MLDRTPQVFISYSWTNKSYQETIISWATRMRCDGVDVKLDVWDLKDGQDKYVYMEQCVTNPDIDKVLIFSDRMYSEKADQRKGGVGDETTIISAEVYGKAAQQKFIPVIMERDENGKEYLPAYLKSRIFRDLSGENAEEEYQELLRTIFEEPRHRKPEIGKRPAWLTKDKPAELYHLADTVKALGTADLSKMKDAAARDFVDQYIGSMKQFYVKNINKETYLKNFTEMKEYRNVFLDHLRTFSAVDHFGTMMADEFERLYNSLFNILTFDPQAMACGETDFELFRLHVWELFVCTVTFMLHFELYSDIHELLVHTYFLRTSALNGEQRAFCYEGLRIYPGMLEDCIKPTMDGALSRKFTLAGHYICTEREYMPIYTGRSMANADLFLYQVFNGLNLDGLTQFGPWFPTLYLYADEYDSIWKKLVSRRFCEKIMPVFGAKTVEELKNRLEKCKPDKKIGYPLTGKGHASAILSHVNLNEIATLP